MTYESMMLFAENWIATWNRRDVDAVLMDYADEAEFVSPVARSIVGRAILSALEFKVDHAIWDERRRELVVIYEANLNGERKRACEIMQFGPTGQQTRGEALYGAVM